MAPVCQAAATRLRALHGGERAARPPQGRVVHSRAATRAARRPPSLR
ncbi:hypothetical protein FM106_18065 [Brachybacterium faecium]|nr:hypothetical protein FM106_18065 [Brachybacterium faecium]